MMAVRTLGVAVKAVPSLASITAIQEVNKFSLSTVAVLKENLLHTHTHTVLIVF